ncbi:MAG: TRZ/ATZ family hydrolase [Xanthomonadales bacterium]|nr:TRZ/ATZ family hydrolase [Xanthomonadales bacterium]
MRVLICPKYLVPVRPAGEVLVAHAVLFDQVSGTIESVGPQRELAESHPDAERVRLDHHVLLPGLVNMHTHSPMTLLRGLADDLPLGRWLADHIWPAEAQWADGEFVAAGTRLALAAMIRGGTTCFNENYFFPDRIADEVSRAGLRAFIGLPVIAFKTRWADNPKAYLERGAALAERYADHSLIRFAYAPHALYSVPDEALVEIGEQARRRDWRVHLHLLESGPEIGESIERHDLHPLEHARKVGLLNERLIAVHMVQLTDADVARVAASGAHVVHCPHSNLKLGNGICPVPELIAAGVNVSLGTDGAASNNALSLLSELKTAALLAKGHSGDATSLPATQADEMVTLNSACALGLEDRLGTIEPGKQADLCAINLDDVRTQPVHDLFSLLVYAVSDNQVSDVWVAGRRLLERGELTTLDESRILDEASQWERKLRQGVGND